MEGRAFKVLGLFLIGMYTGRQILENNLLSKTRLTEHVYDQDFDRDSNLIEVYVKRLREKIGRARIETRRGQGYVFRS